MFRKRKIEDKLFYDVEDIKQYFHVNIRSYDQFIKKEKCRSCVTYLYRSSAKT